MPLWPYVVRCIGVVTKFMTPVTQNFTEYMKSPMGSLRNGVTFIKFILNQKCNVSLEMLQVQKIPPDEVCIEGNMLSIYQWQDFLFGITINGLFYQIVFSLYPAPNYTIA